MKAFRTAVEARDLDAVGALLADDVTFRSPVAFKPYDGRPLVHAILRGVLRVFEDFRYVNEIDPSDSADSVLIFEARIGDVGVSGADFIHVNPDGLIDDFTVMVRPLSAANALAAAMGAQFERIAEEATATSARPPTAPPVSQLS